MAMFLSPNRTLLFVFIFLFSTAAFSQVYKWVDEDGVVHYGDSPPEDAESEVIHVESGEARKADETVSRLVEHAEESAKRRAEARQAKSAVTQAEAQERLDRQKHCKYARKQLSALQARLPVYRDEEGTFRTVSRYDVYEGNRDYLDDTARDIEIERTQRDITAACEHPGDQGKQFVAGWERMMSKRCEAAQADLKSVERPEARSAQHEVELARKQVEKYCETGN